MGRFNPIQLALLGAAAALAVALIFSSMEDEVSAEPVGAPPATQSDAAAPAKAESSWSIGEPEDEPAPDKPTRYEFPEHTGATRTVRFAKALVLTLPRAKQRQASVRKNLARYKLPPVEFVDAVDRGALKEGCDTVPDERGRPGWRPGKPPGWLTFATPCLQRRIDAGYVRTSARSLLT